MAARPHRSHSQRCFCGRCDLMALVNLGPPGLVVEPNRSTTLDGAFGPEYWAVTTHRANVLIQGNSVFVADTLAAVRRDLDRAEFVWPDVPAAVDTRPATLLVPEVGALSPTGGRQGRLQSQIREKFEPVGLRDSRPRSTMGFVSKSGSGLPRRGFLQVTVRMASLRRPGAISSLVRSAPVHARYVVRIATYRQSRVGSDLAGQFTREVASESAPRRQARLPGRAPHAPVASILPTWPTSRARPQSSSRPPSVGSSSRGSRRPGSQSGTDG